MPKAARKYVLCIRNTGYEASLERLKLYRVLRDREAARHDQIRVVDESGESYIYPTAFFAPIDLPLAVRKAVGATA